MNASERVDANAGAPATAGAPANARAAAGVTTVTVAILTYLRPDEVVRAVAAVLAEANELTAETESERPVDVGVLVIDNDPAGGAEAVIAGIDSSRLRYVHEPVPGIAAGRNRALDESAASDLLVFLDDDEVPREPWLRPLLDTWVQTRPAAVVGRVMSEFSTDLGPWVTAGEFFTRRSMPTGTEVVVAATNNLLLDLAQIRAHGLRFDDRLGLSGGEDTLFTRQLIRRGGRMVWCNESVAVDHVPADRATRAWVLARAWSSGNAASVVELYLVDGRMGRIASRARSVARGSVRVAGGSARFVVGTATRSLRHQARGLRSVYRGGGMVAGAFGFVFNEYGRDAS